MKQVLVIGHLVMCGIRAQNFSGDSYQLYR
jgi:hypothetical protein